jgi:branched-chain amino acid transport system ATP-binding protein
VSEPLLRVEQLSARYGQAQVLFDVSLTLRAGEVVALVGRNGAGKSTTLKAIMGLVARSAERLTFADHDLTRLEPYQAARLGLGYVPEERRIFTDLTVAENLEVGRQAPREGLAPWTIEALLRVFPNLAEMLNRRASQMSGGEQQMLTIARTLLGNPRAVLLDEPSEGLAPVIVQQMAASVAAMKRQGLAVLLSEQNLGFAAKVADRAVVIDKGLIRHDGPMTAFMADATLRETWLGAAASAH